MDETNKMLADHYQKTFELTLQMWEQRNTTFLLLLAVVGGATVLTFKVAQAEPLLVDIIAKIAGITEASRLTELRQSFPYGIVQSILLMTVLYLMLLLYHRTAFIRRCYAYLGDIEPELRSGLGLAPASIAFTREGVFYLQHRTPFARLVGLTYMGMLGSLLLAFLVSRIVTDFANGNLVIGVVDLVLAAPTMLFFVGYVRSS